MRGRPNSRNSIRRSISSCSRTLPPFRDAVPRSECWSVNSRRAQAIGGPRTGDLHLAAGKAQERHSPPGQPFAGRTVRAHGIARRGSRLNFAKHFAACRQIPLSSQAAEVLARKGPATPREILAALVNLDLDARAQRARFGHAARRSATQCGQDAQDRSLTQIAKAVAGFYGVPVSQLRSTARPKRSV